MKKIALCLGIFLLLGLMCMPAAAAEGGSASLKTELILASDGSAQVTTTVSLQLEQLPQDLTYPIPLSAQNVQLNGTNARTRADGTCLQVLLPGASAGNTSFVLTYRLPDAVQSEKNGRVQLQLQLLSGFAYPIRQMEFSVQLPGAIEGNPLFSSGYHQGAIADRLMYSLDKNTLTGAVTQVLMDHETLSVTLEADSRLFPAWNVREPLLTGWDWAVLALVAVACIYYLVFLLPVIPRRVRCCTVPDGISAGEVGTCITGCGPDLTMMVITWAQLGYLRLQIDRDRVLLHKQMDMGNERSHFEMRAFQSLFRSRSLVDGTSYHYAKLCRKVAAQTPQLAQLFLPSSGNPRIYRIAATAAGAVSGLSMGLAFTDRLELQVLLGLILALLCGTFSYFIQSGGKCLPLRSKTPLYFAIGCCILWLGLGIAMGQPLRSAPMVLFQFISGFAAAYGGRRSERGKRCLAQIMSLRRFMVSAPGPELQRMLGSNPNYFYELAPYALAMGVDKTFSKRFGKVPLPDCSFLETGSHREMTAQELARQLARAADMLNALQKRLPYERLTGKK